MVFTHMDEPGMVVKSIDGKGFLRFDTIGIIKPMDLASQEVYVYGKKKLLGLIGLRPPHILTEKERKAPVTMDELNIDIGLSRDEVEKIISVGNTASIKRTFSKFDGSMVSGKALCDRAGISIVYEVIKNMGSIDMDVYFAFGVQHYNSYAGAVRATNYVKPDIALVIDSVEAKSRENLTIPQACGKGPVIYMGPTAHPNLTRDLVEFACSNSTEYQVKASSGRNATDAWAIQVACGGIPLALVMTPVKYRFSSVEVMDMADIIRTAKLLNGYIGHLSGTDWGGLLCC